MSNHKKFYPNKEEKKVKQFNKNGFEVTSPRPPKESKRIKGEF